MDNANIFYLPNYELARTFTLQTGYELARTFTLQTGGVSMALITGTP
jgi:hypothetical protein